MDLFQKLLKTSLSFNSFSILKWSCRAIVSIALLWTNPTLASSSSSSSSYRAPTPSRSTSSSRSTTPSRSFSPSRSSTTSGSSRSSFSSPSRATTIRTPSNSNSFSSGSSSFPSAPEPPKSSSTNSGEFATQAKEAKRGSGSRPGLTKIRNYREKASTVKRVKENFRVNRQIKIQASQGQFTYGNKIVEPGEEGLVFGKVLETKDSNVTLFINEYDSNVQIRANSKVALFKKDHQIDLIKGSIFIDKNKGRGLDLESKNSKINIIKGESLTLFKPLLSETELIVFDGKTQMNNLGDHSDKTLVETGQWAGIGGRYSASIGDTVNLPEKFLKSYKKALKK